MNNTEIEIPFVDNDEIVTGQEDRILLFASIAAKDQAVPKDWLLEQLGISSASMASLISRYGYSMKTQKTKDGTSVIRLSIKGESEE